MEDRSVGRSCKNNRKNVMNPNEGSWSSRKHLCAEDAVVSRRRSNELIPRVVALAVAWAAVSCDLSSNQA